MREYGSGPGTAPGGDVIVWMFAHQPRWYDSLSSPHWADSPLHVRARAANLCRE